MKRDLVYTIAIIILSLLLFKQCETSNDFNKQRTELHKQNKALHETNKRLYDTIYQLDREISLERTKIRLKDKEIDSVKSLRQKVVYIVKDLTENQKDSIINSYTKDEVVATLIDYPLVKTQLSLTLEQNKMLEWTIGLLEKRAGLKDNVIANHKKEISNLNKEIDLFEQEVKKRSTGGFIYGQVNMNGFNSYGAGFDYVWGKIIAGANINYDTFASPDNLNINVKLGVKIF